MLCVLLIEQKKNHFLALSMVDRKMKDNDITNLKNWCWRDHPKDLDDNGIQEHIGQTSPTEVAKPCAVRQ